MFAKVAILFAALVAVNATALLHGAALAHTGSSAESRTQDALGNYAFNYDIADGHASVKSRAEVGDGFGNKHGTYSSRINHVAPAAVAVAHPAPLAYAAPIAHAAPLAHAPLGYAAPLAHAAPLAYAAPLAHAAPIATAYSSAVNHVAPAPVIAGHYGAYGRGLYGHGLLAPALVH